jgi:hypothetical protein
VDLTSLTAEITVLRERGLTAYDVAEDFVRRQLSPLRSRASGAWEALGFDDPAQNSNRGESVPTCLR